MDNPLVEAQAGGWWGRARRLLAERGADCVEWGYILFTDAVQQLMSADAAAASITLSEVEAIGRRFADSQLLNVVLYLRGRALILLGRSAEGLAALDEVMVAATSGELHLLEIGQTYCGMLGGLRCAARTRMDPRGQSLV